MKSTMRCLAVAVALLALGAQLAQASEAKTGDKTITKVVKLLQNMLEKSKQEGDDERKIYAKFKCYCDQSDAEKTQSIDENTKVISILESKIEELQGSTGELSSKCAELKADMAENKMARDEADGIRKKQNTAFKGERDDLTQAIGQMRQAIDTLTKVGADQTASTGADNKQFLAGHSSLLSLGSSMQTALSAAEAFMSEKEYNKFTSFLQAPFTGTYTSQSGQVMGIIKNMRDTFKANLATAIETENEQLKNYNEFIGVKTEAFNEMKGLYGEAQDKLGSNDGELGSARGQLQKAQKAKAEDEEFLEKLRPMCEEKGKDYEERKLLRANEDVAIAEAVSILNSDAAFDTFGDVSATSTGAHKAASFMQISRSFPTDDVRAVMQRLLKRAAAEAHHSPRLTHVISQLQAGNPFDTVLDEIDKMLDVIKDEGVADKEKNDWCKQERKENKDALKEKNGDILKLDGKIDKLSNTIEDPATGLKKQIEETENSLVQNDNSQKTETADRQESNVAYQHDVKTIVAAKSLLQNAIKVLEAYYDKIDSAFLQSMGASQEDPAPPGTWKNDDYKGQSAKGGDAISMLKFILAESQKEEEEAHSGEEKGQASYEDSMAQLKKEQAEKEKNLVDLQDTLAEKEQDLLDAQEDLKSTTADKEAVENYLEKIHPGCEFMKVNFDQRNTNRATETKALKTAMSTLKGSPAYQDAVSEATVESYGKCKKPCVADAVAVECKACQADVTIPAYCAGHEGTKGC